MEFDVGSVSVRFMQLDGHPCDDLDGMKDPVMVIQEGDCPRSDWTMSVVKTRLVFSIPSDDIELTAEEFLTHPDTIFGLKKLLFSESDKNRLDLVKEALAFIKEQGL